MGKTRLVCLLLALSPFAFGQANHGELRLKVTDPAGLGVRTAVQIVSEANEYRNTLNTDAEGNLIAQRLPYGIYRLKFRSPVLRRSHRPSMFKPPCRWITTFS